MQSPFVCNKLLSIASILIVAAAIWLFQWALKKLSPRFPDGAHIGVTFILMPLGLAALRTLYDPLLWVCLGFALVGLTMVVWRMGRVG